jgi:hypothetical protein
MAQTINQKSGLGARIDVTDPVALQHAVDRLMDMVQIMNGERGAPGSRVVTRGELLDTALKNP